MLRQPPELRTYPPIRYTERLREAGIESSLGRVGDSYDNALAKSVIHSRCGLRIGQVTW